MKYEIGTEVQNKDGSVRKKISEGKRVGWMSKGRYEYQRENQIVLKPHQRVFHKNGNKADNSPENLVPISFGLHAYKLERARVVFTPRSVNGRVRVTLRQPRQAVLV